MARTLGSIFLDEPVQALLDKADDLPTGVDEGDRRAMSREQAAAMIHAVLWAYSSRADSQTGAFSKFNLRDVVRSLGLPA